MSETNVDAAPMSTGSETTPAPTKALAHAILENDPASEWMGIEVIKIDDGHATITMKLRPEMLNGFGIAHGGMLFAFADSAFALACNPSAGSADTITVASGVDINFMRPGIPGRLLTAVANRRAQTGRSGLYDIQVLQSVPGAEDEVLAEFRGRSRTIRKR